MQADLIIYAARICIFMKSKIENDNHKTESAPSESGMPSIRKVVLDALLREYEVALMLDLQNDTYEIFKLTGRLSKYISRYLKNHFSSTMLEIADSCLYSYDYDFFIGAVSLENLRMRMESDESCSFVFRAITSRGPEYFRMRVIRADDNNKVFAGVSCIQDEMSREMQQRKLFEGALDRARSADSAKSTFLTNMSHDIRTPMNAIIGFTNIAATHLDDKEKVKDALDKIRTSSDHLMGLINDVLDMSRIESGRLTIKEKKNSLTAIAGDIERILQPQIQSKGLTFIVDMDSVAAPDVYCDETRITQLLLNLLGNSVKYTQPGGKVTLTVRQKKTGKARRYNRYEFLITDNGIGISPEFLPQIFEPFERESSRLQNNTYGSGLGMSIAKGIVDLMGGSIEVESEENVGTRFKVILEFRPVNADGDREEEETDSTTVEEAHPMLSYPGSGDEDMAIFHSRVSTDSADTGDAGWIEGRRLLLVEDNALNREIAQEMLLEDGFKVETAENGKQALLKITGADPWYYAAVLMDIQMPVMDGYEATERIRMLSDKSKARIPVIAMTANAFNEDRIRAAECGMDAYITKPVDVLTLRYVLRRVLR